MQLQMHTVGNTPDCTLLNAMSDLCRKAMREHLVSSFVKIREDSEKKHVALEKMTSRMMYERGPWASFMLSQINKDRARETFWCLNFTQNDSMVPLLLVPNPKANRHKVASQIQRSGKLEEEKDEDEDFLQPGSCVSRLRARSRRK